MTKTLFADTASELQPNPLTTHECKNKVKIQLATLTVKKLVMVGSSVGTDVFSTLKGSYYERATNKCLG